MKREPPDFADYAAWRKANPPPPDAKTLTTKSGHVVFVGYSYRDWVAKGRPKP